MTQANGNQRAQTSTVRQSVRILAHDAIELGELQARLLKLDATESARNLRSSAILLCIALAALLAALPVALLACGEALVQYAEWSRPAALGISAGGGMLACVLLLLLTWGKLRHAFGTWQRSAHELDRNVAWLKSALRGDGSADTKPDGTNPERSTRN